MQLEENIVGAHMLLTQSRNQHVPAFRRCASGKLQSSLPHAMILQRSRMRRSARTDLCGGRFVRTVPTATRVSLRLVWRFCPSENCPYQETERGAGDDEQPPRMKHQRECEQHKNKQPKTPSFWPVTHVGDPHWKTSPLLSFWRGNLKFIYTRAARYLAER